MHELGITNAILRTVEQTAREQHALRVNSVTIEIGALSGVIPHFLLNCWEAVREGTAYQQTALIMIEVPGALRCEDCGNSFPADFRQLRCPSCGGTNLTPVGGLEMTIREIEVET